MRKKLTFLFMIIFFGLLSACGSSDDNKSDNSETKSTFTGTIETIDGKNAIVGIEDGEILRSGRKASVDLSAAGDTVFEIGDKIKVGYDGTIQEKYPLGITTTFVELIDWLTNIEIFPQTGILIEEDITTS